MRFQKKAEFIEAVKWDGTDEAIQAIQKMIGVEAKKSMNDALYICYPPLMRIALNEWIIKGKIYPCQDKIFQENYERSD
jgi:hypothetical protein